MVMEDVTCSGDTHSAIYDDVFYSCIPETYIILLTNITQISSKNFFKSFSF